MSGGNTVEFNVVVDKTEREVANLTGTSSQPARDSPNSAERRWFRSHMCPHSSRALRRESAVAVPEAMTPEPLRRLSGRSLPGAMLLLVGLSYYATYDAPEDYHEH